MRAGQRAGMIENVRNTPTPREGPDMYEEEYRRKLTTAEEAVKVVKPGDWVDRKSVV